MKPGLKATLGSITYTIIILHSSLAIGAEAEKPLPYQAKTIMAAKTYVSNNLKDPGSAQFCNISVLGTHICGEINAKNSYGAYTGFVPFYAEGGFGVIVLGGVATRDNDVEQHAYDRTCQRAEQ